MEVNLDASGVSVVITTDKALCNFPGFLDWVEENAIGAEDGVFKVCLEDGIERGTSLQDCQRFIVDQMKHDKYAPQKQKFLRVSMSEEVYEYVAISLLTVDSCRQEFQNTMANCKTFTSAETCCTQVLKEGGMELLLKHYFNSLRRAAVPAYLESKKSNTEIQKMLQKGKEDKFSYELKKICFFDSCGIDNEQSICQSIDDLNATSSAQSDSSTSKESDYEPAVKKLDKKNQRCKTIILSTSVFKGSSKLEMCRNFSLSKLSTILDYIPRKYDGLTRPYTYFGTEHSTFASHIEGAGLWSITANYFGSPRIWIVIPPKYAGLFHYHISQEKINIDHASCSNLLGHKVVLVNTDYLDVRRVPYKVTNSFWNLHVLPEDNICTPISPIGDLDVVQCPGELLILRPFVVHMGFNTGPNIGESINFATESCLPMSLYAPRCSCLGRNLCNLDLSPLLCAFRPDLFMKYVNGNILLPYSEHPMSVHEPPLHVKVKMHLEGEHKASETESRDSIIEETQQQDDLLQGRVTKSSCRLTLECPVCPKTFQGGPGRVGRLLHHMKKQHQSLDQSLIDEVHQKFTRKKHSFKKASKLCSKCGKVFGRTYHLNRHSKYYCKF